MIDRSAGRGEGRFSRAIRTLVGRPSLVVGAIVLLAAAVAAAFSAQIVGYEPDEIGYTHLAIGIAHSLLPITFQYGGAQRLNQLYPLLIAPLWGPFGNVTAFRIAHIWNALLLASAAIPTYLLAREVVPQRWAAYLAAALVAFMPWMTLSTTELTEVAAFPACAWALLAMQRSLAAPSARRDLLALAGIALASYGRLQLIVLAPVLVVAMLVHELSYGFRHHRGRAGLREALGRTVRQHAPLSAIAVVGVLVGVPLLLSGVLASAAGFYSDTLAGVTLNSATFDLARSYLVFIAIGLGGLPVALAFGFFAESLIAPVSKATHAFATLAILTILLLTLQVAEISVRFEGNVLQERYLFYIVPLLVVGMCAALLLTRHPLRMILGGSAVVAALTASTHYQSVRNAFWYQVSPAMTGFYDWIRPAFGAAGGPTADPGASRQVLAGVVVLGLGLLVAALSRRISRPRLLAGVATVAIVFCAAETVHALWRVVHGNASGRGFGSGSLSDVDWVDRHLPSGASVEQVVSNVGGLDESRGLWEDSEFWNRSIVGAYTFGTVIDSYYATTRLSLNAQTGTIGIGSSGLAQALPSSLHYLVTAARGFPVQVAGNVLARSADGTLELLQLAVPTRAAWAVTGASSDGWLALDSPSTLRLYMLAGAPSRCATVGVTLSLSALSSSARRLVLDGPRVSREVSFAPGQARTLYTRVCGQAGAVPQLQMLNGQNPAASDPQITLQLLRVTVTPS
jgi:hypothetical protein